MALSENASAPMAWRQRPQAPQPGAMLCAFGQLADGSSREFTFGVGLNAFRMFVVRKGPDLYGYVNLCPHYSLPLNVRDDEFLSRDGCRIMCRRHLAIFSIEDGLCTDGACIGSALDAVPLRIDDAGMVLIG